MPNFNVHPQAYAIQGRYRFTHKQIIAVMQFVGEANRAAYKPPLLERCVAEQSYWTVLFCMPRYSGPVARLQ